MKDVDPGSLRHCRHCRHCRVIRTWHSHGTAMAQPWHGQVYTTPRVTLWSEMGCFPRPGVYLTPSPSFGSSPVRGCRKRYRPCSAV